MKLLETIEPIVAKMVYQKLESSMTEKFSIRARGVHGGDCMGTFFETYFPNFSKKNLRRYVFRYYSGCQDAFNSIEVGKLYGIQIAKHTFMTVKKRSTNDLIVDSDIRKLTEKLTAQFGKENNIDSDSVFVIESESLVSKYDNLYEFTIVGKNKKEYRNKIISAIQKVVNEKTKTQELDHIQCIYLSSSNYDNSCIYRRKVYNNDIIFPEMTELDKKIDYFVHNSEFYKSNNIPYRMSILLYGVPGTGKTSYFDYIATKYNCKIITIRVDGRNEKGSKRSVSEIISVIRDEVDFKKKMDVGVPYDPREKQKFESIKSMISIVLLDELDLMLSDSMQLKDLLYLIDNVPENTIIGATTNHIDKLDPALIRSGRFDIRVELKDFGYDSAYKLCKNYKIQNIDSCIPTNLTEEEKEKFTINPAYLKTIIVSQLLRENGFDSEVKEILPED